MTTHELEIDGETIQKGDTVVCTVVDGDEAAETEPMVVSGGYRDAAKLIVGIDGQSVGSLSATAPIGAHRRWDGEVIGALDFEVETGNVRDLIGIEVL